MRAARKDAAETARMAEEINARWLEETPQSASRNIR
jgi:hypothetical protein